MEKTVETGLNRTGLDMAPRSKDDMVSFARSAGAARRRRTGIRCVSSRRRPSGCWATSTTA